MTEVDDVLVAMWEVKRPVALERLSVVELAIDGAAAGAMTARQRTVALEAAHKLAGALGMYGFAHGSDVCRRAETFLGAPLNDDDAASRREAAQVARQLAALRTDLMAG